MEIGLQRFLEIREDLQHMVAREPHELMRATEVRSIIDCAEMAARASLYRTESRWGLYHYRVDHPETDENWFCHTQLYRDGNGAMTMRKQPVAPYVVPIPEEERDAYQRLRIPAATAAE
jgi:succinate dehydrogenase/fumarate reductase flavoprotein subunit